jgi:hypothetical protein
MNLLNIKSFADFRAWLHVALPAVAGVLAIAGYVSSNDAGLWVALALVVIDAGLSAFNSANNFRTFLYPFLAAGGALLVRYGYTTDQTWALWTGLAPVFFGSAVAAANTDTTPANG